MTVISSDPETPVSDAGADKTRQRRTQQSSRRQRSLRCTNRRNLDQMLGKQQIFRAGLVLLPLAGFLHISLTNDVLGPDNGASDSITSEHSSVNRDSLTGSDEGMLKHTRFDSGTSDDHPAVAPTNARPTVSVTRLASAWSTGDPGLSRLSPERADGADGDEGAMGSRAKVEPLTSDAAATGRSFGRPTIYVVNEGGSLWRTGKRFIDDEVLLDKMIDILAESGMEVRSVSAGVEFIVNDLGSEGLLVVVYDGNDSFESQIFEDSVTASARRQAEIGVDSTRTVSLDQKWLDH